MGSRSQAESLAQICNTIAVCRAYRAALASSCLCKWATQWAQWSRPQPPSDNRTSPWARFSQWWKKPRAVATCTCHKSAEVPTVAFQASSSQQPRLTKARACRVLSRCKGRSAQVQTQARTCSTWTTALSRQYWKVVWQSGRADKVTLSWPPSPRAHLTLQHSALSSSSSSNSHRSQFARAR